MELKSLDLKGLFFILLLVGLGLVMLRIFTPFLDIIIVALVLVQIFHPLYNWFKKRLKFSGVASILTTLIALIFVVLPIILIGFLAVFEITGIISDLQVKGISEQTSLYADLEDRINGALNSLDSSLESSGIDLGELLQGAGLIEDHPEDVLAVDIPRIINQVLVAIQSNIAPVLTGLVSGGVTVLFFAFLLIVTMLYLFVEHENLPKAISKVSPLDDEVDELLYKKFTETNRAVITGSFFVAIAQATSVSLMFAIMGIGAPILFWMLMVILSLIPVGSGLVWFPVGLALIVSGRVVEGMILIVYSAVIINVIDSYLRPRVMKNAVQLHPLIIIFSALGGISTFGPLGILYGPVIAVFFSSLMNVYAERYSTDPAHKRAR